MILSPDITEILARARADLRMGVPVVLCNGDSQGALMLSAETLRQDRLEYLTKLSQHATLAITSRRAQTLKVHAYDGDLARIVLPRNASAAWVHGIADPASDLISPMKGPFTAQREGSPDLHRFAISLAKAARLLPAAVLAPLENPGPFARDHSLTLIDAKAGALDILASSPLHSVVSARLPLAVSEAGRLHVFRPEDGAEEHYAVEIGHPDRDSAVLTRLHSACFTGDLLGSLKCDCGPQLRGALAMMGNEGAGVLLYLNQEGRGIGLANKMRAYSLQDQGFDTVEANHRLGFEDDERDFRIGAAILRQLGFSRVRLLTNNPNKVAMMEKEGIAVDSRVPLKVPSNAHNKAYLATKAKKSGHIL